MSVCMCGFIMYVRPDYQQHTVQVYSITKDPSGFPLEHTALNSTLPFSSLFHHGLLSVCSCSSSSAASPPGHVQPWLSLLCNPVPLEHQEENPGHQGGNSNRAGYQGENEEGRSSLLCCPEGNSVFLPTTPSSDIVVGAGVCTESKGGIALGNGLLKIPALGMPTAFWSFIYGSRRKSRGFYLTS